MPLQTIMVQITLNHVLETRVSSVKPFECPLSFDIVTENELVLIPDVLVVQVERRNESELQNSIVFVFNTFDDELYKIHFSYETKNNLPDCFKDSYYERKTPLIRPPFYTNILM